MTVDKFRLLLLILRWTFSSVKHKYSSIHTDLDILRRMFIIRLLLFVHWLFSYYNRYQRARKQITLFPTTHTLTHINTHSLSRLQTSVSRNIDRHCRTRQTKAWTVRIGYSSSVGLWLSESSRHFRDIKHSWVVFNLIWSKLLVCIDLEVLFFAK